MTSYHVFGQTKKALLGKVSLLLQKQSDQGLQLFAISAAAFMRIIEFLFCYFGFKVHQDYFIHFELSQW